MSLSLIFTLSCIVSVRCALKLWAGAQQVSHAPGMRPALSPISLFGAVIPTFRWNPGLEWQWEWRTTAYFNRTYDVISLVPWLSGNPSFSVASLAVVKQLLNRERDSHLVKPRELTSPLHAWGENLFSANNEDWRRHRRVVAPAFTPKTYAMVWKETRILYRDMCASERWSEKREFIVNNINRLPLKFSFIIISRCGFGLPMSWVEDEKDKGYRESLMTVLDTSIARLVLPRWSYKLPIKRLQRMEKAWVTLATFMHKIVEEKKQELSQGGNEDESQKGDVFTRLVAAFDDAAKYGLTEEEVIGNTFTLMFAGHESTSVALSATLGYLAIHQDHQEKVYSEIKEVVHDREPVLEDMSRVPHLQACFKESLRLFPVATMIARDLGEDTPINLKHPTEKTVVFKKGSRVIVDLIGLQRDPYAFPEPAKFVPDRWYGIGDHDMPMFGVGPRSCIGQRFSMAEATCFLILFLRDWKIDVVLKDGETREAYEERFENTAGRIGLAFGIGPLDLKLTRRI